MCYPLVPGSTRPCLMLELTGIAPFFELVSWAYWVLGGFFVWFAWRAIADRRRRIVVVSAIAIAFSILPALSWWHTHERKAYAAAARAYYEQLCVEKAGIKIYRKVSGVKSVVVLKPLPPSTDEDNFNQYWYGDPYSGPASEFRQRATYSSLVSKDAPNGDKAVGDAFEAIEVKAGGEMKGAGPYFRIFHVRGARDVSVEPLLQPISRFGVEWEDISTSEDRRYWVAGSRLRVFDLVDRSVVAERIGFLIEGGLGSRAGGRRPWLTGHKPTTTCPIAHDFSDRQFLVRVLDPLGG